MSKKKQFIKLVVNTDGIKDYGNEPNCITWEPSTPPSVLSNIQIDKMTKRKYMTSKPNLEPIIPISKARIKTTDEINEETFKRQALDEMNYNPKKAEAIPELKEKDRAPQITVDIKFYLRLRKLIMAIQKDVDDLQKIYKYMNWDNQQDALKYSKKITENTYKLELILFPGSSYK